MIEIAKSTASRIYDNESTRQASRKLLIMATCCFGLIGEHVYFLPPVYDLAGL